jgi:hypothetical protein
MFLVAWRKRIQPRGTRLIPIVVKDVAKHLNIDGVPTLSGF